VTDKPLTEFEEDTFTLDEGTVLIQRPKRISRDSFTELERFMELVMARARRSVLGTERN